MTDMIGEIVLTQDQIEEGVNLVAERITHKYLGEEVVFIVVVPGGIFFAADLLRKLPFHFSIDHVACHHTPGSSQNHSPIIYQNDIELTGKHLVLVDDAIETGGTMKRVAQYFANTKMYCLSQLPPYL
ncbi:phosphoribosyltransferase [Vibrio sonorensis]|uniref:phosphoribosyltransferase n=1 Tax=Vibrio sonorensis TaxID=1004316 RepID=UPI000AAAB4A7